MSDLLALGAVAASAAVAAGDLDPADLIAAYREQAAGDEHNAFVHVPEEPPEHGRGPLAGLPVAVKDLFCVEDQPSQACSRILAGYRPPYTATVVERILDAGAAALGKTNQDEFAMGSSNENSAFGPVTNPWDPARVPGGSSGGSAAAVAAGSALWALGTDTGGSVRQPASLCGVVGIKPTYGAVSRYGIIAFASSLDQAGPIARDVADAALLLRHMVGHDTRDATSLPFPEPIEIPAVERLDGLTIGVPDDLTGEGVEPGVMSAFEAALTIARDLGARIERVSLPHAAHALSAYYVIAPAEASANLARFDGVRYGLRADSDSLLDMYTTTRHDGFGAEVKRRIMLGTYVLSSGYYDAYYGTAQKVRTRIVEDYRTAFGRVDVIATPTSPSVAWPLGERISDPLAMYMADSLTVPVSLAGIPALSLPCGLSQGLPVGLQLAGPAFSENRLLGTAKALETAIGFGGAPWQQKGRTA